MSRYPLSGLSHSSLPVLQNLLKGLAARKFVKPPFARIHPRVAYRAIFSGDVHLGPDTCLGEDLYLFEKHVMCDYRGFLGDWFDFHAMGIHRVREIGKIAAAISNHPWQSIALDEIFSRSKKGTEVFAIPGNHDHLLNYLRRKRYGNISIVPDCCHQAADGRFYLLTHGHAFDNLIRGDQWLGIAGTRLYGALARTCVLGGKAMRWSHATRALEAAGLSSDWSLAERIKSYVDGKAFSSAYKEAMIAYLHACNARQYLKRKATPEKAHLCPEYHGIFSAHSHVAFDGCFESPKDPETGKPMGPEKVRCMVTGHFTGDGNGQSSLYSQNARVSIVEEKELDADGRSVFSLVQMDREKGVIPFSPPSPC